MKALAFAMSVMIGIAACFHSAIASEETAEQLLHERQVAPVVRTAERSGLRTNAISPTDTTWIGYTPGHFNAANNWWSIYSGSGATGFGRPIAGQPSKGVWTWDEPVSGDSLQGWWPFRSPDPTGYEGDNDRSRPHTCVDIGNQANYVLRGARGANWQGRANGTEPGWRTFGVDGIWHVDGGSTVAVAGVPAPTWAPLQGSRSVWMGLRAHGDVSHVDPLTGNAFNEDVVMFNALGSFPNEKRFPGYANLLDQLLYRDIDLGGTPDTSLTISFRYRTNLSSNLQNVALRFGWFHHDPLGTTSGATNPQPNNFISGTDAGVNRAPIDSFMVYIGAGVEDGSWRGSDGALHSIYDKKHRWFAEVLHADWDPGSNPADPRPLYYRQLVSVAGTVSPTTATFTIPSGILQRFLEKSPRVRLVFRVKTNRVSSDEDFGLHAYSSNGAGAAVVDDVRIRVGAGPETTLGDFESLAAIDNDPAVTALDTWKSTGKPPASHFHVETVEPATYQDLCGPAGGDARLCNTSGPVLLCGDHDRNEEVGNQIEGDSERDGRWGVSSPTIQLVDDDGNPGTPNPIGLYGVGGNGGVGDIVATEDYRIRFDRYSGDINGNNGLFYRISAQSYPVLVTTASPPYPGWGRIHRSLLLFADPSPVCEQVEIGLRAFGLLSTSNANGIPDSIRVGMDVLKLDYAFEIYTGYPYLNAPFIDNLSFGILDHRAGAGLTVDILSWLQDTFPANETPGYPGNASLFDTTAALAMTGDNIAESGGGSNYNAPGDSIVVAGNFARLDMVFRVLPGPGNYEPVGDGVGGMLRKVPSNPATVTPSDGSWWDVLQQNPGEFASPNAVVLMQAAAAGWDPNVWISVRCDTAERNLYPRGGMMPNPTVGRWRSTIHESDPRFASLGIVRNRCFVRTAGGSTNDIVCDGTVPSYLPPGTAATTVEGTKIVPDGLLTPGAHVEYFFRAQTQTAPGANAAMLPDTNVVFPQIETSFQWNTDGLRWQHFSVLPDRWKDPQYRHPVLQQYGQGPGCLLVVDWADRLGDERAWVSVADTIGATRAEKYGAHNGWHARGDQDPNDPSAWISTHGGSPGTTWDLYQVKGAEMGKSVQDGRDPSGTIGTRLGYRDGSPLGARTARNAPTLEMLNAYYRLMLILTGNLERNILGPFERKLDDDVGILTSWLAAGDTEMANRGLWIMGNGFVDAHTLHSPGPPQTAFASDVLHAGLVNPSYRDMTQSTEPLLQLHVLPEWQGKGAGLLLGVLNPCLTSNLDVLAPAGAPLGQIASRYETQAQPGSGETAGIFKAWDASAPWMSLVEGFSIQDLTGLGHHNATGRSLYFWKVFTNVFAQIWSVAGSVAPLDVPQLSGDDLVNFVRLLGNPATDGRARVRFGLTRADRVEARIYDVAGRLVRVLADRNFPAGQHELVWDGLDQAGNRVARGVYFTRFSYRALGFETSRKLTILQ